ncbi:hypothetical protein ACFOKF_25455 [Sphingobium rhizovicinum]|uniref:Uncharacterized protein n=1 Tax=Sphingobium rhizovicinum TaxID=432308 RepID=A0ABV7NNP5_9SPHN
MTATVNSAKRLTKTQVQGQVNGPLFNLPAGPVQLALLAGFIARTRINMIPARSGVQ